jgi:hypothetical protein
LHKGEVDWWVMLKHPLGYQYSYMDSNNASSSKAGTCVRGSCWQHGLTMQNPNPVSHTLEVLTTVPAAPAAAAGGSLAYAFYNDADPGGTEHFLFAHAKVSALYSSQPFQQRACICMWRAQYGARVWLVLQQQGIRHVNRQAAWPRCHPHGRSAVNWS